MIKKKNFIKEAIKKPGALRKQLGVKEGEKIPKGKLAIKKSDTSKTKKRKILAKTLGKLRKKK